MKYVHYGSQSFDPLRWTSVRNAPLERSFEKPAGGLWASPANAILGWANWCRREDFNLEGLKESFEFELSENTKVLRITSEDVVKSLPRIFDDPQINTFMEHFSKFSLRPFELPIDFEQLSRDYDVVEFLASKLFHPNGILRGWDCDCILVLNKDVIRVTELEK